MTTVLLFAGVMGACDTERTNRSTATVVDSGGIVIVESTAPTGVANSWRVAPEPRATIGDVSGDADRLLYRVYGARALPDSRILISNSGSSQLRVYDEVGELLRSFGREGQGPGEFAEFSSMQLVGHDPDTAFVVDAGNRRINVFALDRGFVRTVSPTLVPDYGQPSVADAFRDRRWLIVAPFGSGRLGGEPGDLIRMRYGLFSYEADGTSATLLATADVRPRMVNSLGGGAIHFPYVPLTPAPLYTAVGDALALASGGTAEIRFIDRNGVVQRIARWSPPRVPVRDIWSRFSETFLDDVSEDRRPAFARLLAMDGLPVPEFLPAVRSLITDRLDYIWAERYRLPWESDRLWDVFDREGFWLGTVQTPAAVTPLEIGSDYILGRHLDELDVERVVVYELSR